MATRFVWVREAVALAWIFGLSSLSAAPTLCPVTSDVPPAQEILPQQDNELHHLDNVIQVTQRTLQSAQAIRKQVQDYLALQDRFATDTDNRELGLRMVKAAQRLKIQIEESHLQHAFDPAFLNELAVLSEMGSKKPKPVL